MGLMDRCSRLAVAAVVAAGTAVTLLLATGSPAAAALPQGPPSLSGGVNGQVYATLVVGNTVFVGGSFSQALADGGGSTTRSNLAAFDVHTGALLKTWRADTDGMVLALSSSGSALFVGGDFATIGGASQARLAKVSLSTGAVDTQFKPKVNGAVHAVAASGTHVYAGGQFSVVDGTAQRSLTELDATTGARITGFTGSADAQVNVLTLSPDGTRLAVGGRFSQLSGVARLGLGLVSPTTGGTVGPSFAASVKPMLTLSWLGDGTALFGGAGGTNNLAARWNTSSGSRTWGFRVGGDAQAIDYYDGNVYLGFHDNYQGNKTTHLLRVDPSTGAVSPSFRPVFNQYWGVRTISAGTWGLVIGGQFTRISGVWARNVAIWRDASAPQIDLSVPATATYGARTDAKVTIPNGTGTVTLTGAGPAQTKTLTGGSATFALPRTLSPGDYSLTAQYSGDSQFLSGSTTGTLTVDKAGTAVRTTVTRKALPRRAGKVKVTVTSRVDGGAAPSGTVKLQLTHGAKHRVVQHALHTTSVRITLPRLRPGTWKLVATYTGDADHKAATHHMRIKVAQRVAR